MFTREQFMELGFEDKIKVMEFKAKFHKKKAKAMAEMERIPKNGFNSQHNYHYARESDVKDKIRPILNENNLSYTMELLKHERGNEFRTKNGAMMVQTNVQMLFTVVDTETGYFEEFTHDGSAMDTGDKGIYKAYSNTIKYALMDYFLIPTGDDVEKDSPEVQPQQPPQKQQPPRQGKANVNKPDQPQQQPPQNGKPTWKTIMDKEDELVEVSGADKAQIRAELKGKFGQLPKYKELDQQAADRVLAALEKWIDNYRNPKA
jgi:hypothetical protein